MGLRFLTSLGILYPILSIFLLLWPLDSQAGVFPLPAANNDIIGQVRVLSSRPGDDLHSIGRRYDIGYFEMLEANPKLEKFKIIPTGTPVIVPSRFILPPGPRAGIVINFAEMRLYYYPKNTHEVITYPVGIGRYGWLMPLGKMKIIGKQQDPTWHVPQAVQQWAASEGRYLPDMVLPGPDNPLGHYSMRFSHPEFLIHGTNKPSGVGMRSSSGCIRMFPEDIEEFWHLTKLQTPVRVINEPFKLGWHQKQLFLEVHQPLQEDDPLEKSREKLEAHIHEITHQIRHPHFDVDWSSVLSAMSHQYGVPVVIGGYNLLPHLAAEPTQLSE